MLMDHCILAIWLEYIFQPISMPVFLRSNNEDVAFICGSDEHGAAITLRAKKEEKHQRKL